MSRTLVFLLVFGAVARECTAAQAVNYPNSGRIAAAEKYRTRGRFLRRRAVRSGHNHVESTAAVMVDEPIRPDNAEPTVVLGPSTAAPQLPARDTEVWPPAWGLFPASGLTE